MSSMAGKLAVVTGGNSGIGFAAAKAFADAGARVVIFGRDAKKLEQAGASLGASCVCVSGDVSRLADLDRLYAAIAKLGIGIDALFVNAGVVRVAPATEVTETVFDEIVATNLKGAYFTVQKALPQFNNGGAIVMNSSVTWHQGMQGLSVYSATKAAVIGLMTNFAGELAARGIRVNAVSPGAIRTPIVGRAGIPEQHVIGFQNMIAGASPLQRVGQPEEVGAVVRFLCSDEASYVTGVEIPVDGGNLLGVLK